MAGQATDYGYSFMGKSEQNENTNVPQRHSKPDLFLKRFTQTWKRKSNCYEFREKSDSSIFKYSTLDFGRSKNKKRTTALEKYQGTSCGNDTCDSSVIVLGNLILTFFRTLERFIKDDDNCTSLNLRAELPKKQEGLIDFVDRIIISTIDLTLVIFQPTSNFKSMMKIIKSSIKKALPENSAKKSNKIDRPFTLKSLFPFIDGNKDFIVEIIRVKKSDKVTKEIIIHSTQKLSSDIMDGIKNIAKKYAYTYKRDLSEDLFPDKLQPNCLLLGNYFQVKKWIQKSINLNKINSDQLHSNKNKTVLDEMIKNLGTDKNAKLSQLIGFYATKIPWIGNKYNEDNEDSEFINLNSEKDIIPFLVDFYFDLVKLGPAKTTFIERFSFFEKDSTIPDIIRKSSLFDSLKEPSFEQVKELFASLKKISEKKVNKPYFDTYQKYEKILQKYEKILQKYEKILSRKQLELANDNHPLLMRK